MFSLANPLALIGLAALAAPLILHLIRRPLPTVRLGSLKFLTESQRRLRSFRWRDLLLLLIRCGLLAVLTLLVAGPNWVPTREEAARWVMRIPGVPLPQAAEHRVEELVAQGYAVRYLSPGFPEEEPVVDAGSLDAWSLMREADLRLPTGSDWIVVGPAVVDYFIGDRPVLRRLRVTWEEVESVGTSGAAVTDALPPAAPVRVAVVASPDRSEDARRVRAAVRALASTDHAVVEVTENPDWIFQLGAGELAPAWRERVRQGATLVTDAPAEIALNEGRTFELQGQTYGMARRGTLPVQDSPEATVIADSVGDPVAKLGRIGEGRHFRFAIRFHPDSTSWVLGSGFPAWWRDQMLGTVNAAPRDRGRVSPRQIEPRSETGPALMPSLPRLDVTDLRLVFWVAALVLLVGERWLALRGDRTRQEEST